MNIIICLLVSVKNREMKSESGFRLAMQWLTQFSYILSMMNVSPVFRDQFLDEDVSWLWHPLPSAVEKGVTSDEMVEGEAVCRDVDDWVKVGPAEL